MTGRFTETRGSNVQPPRERVARLAGEQRSPCAVPTRSGERCSPAEHLANIELDLNITRTGIRRFCIAACLIAWSGACAARAEVRLSPVISDGAVLQRGVKACVWGSADAGEKVTVTFAGQTKTTAADAFGRWRVALDPLSASAKPRPLTAAGRGNTVTVKSVYVGEVWLYLSQSWHLDSRRSPVGPAELAKLPPICAHVPASVWEHQNHSQRPQDGMDGRGGWRVFSPPGKYYRSDAFHFARRLAEAVGVPVGVMALGASTLESMTPPAGFAAVERQMGPAAAEIAAWVPTTARGRKAYLKTLDEIDAWAKRSRATVGRSRISYRDFTQPPSLPGPPAIGRGPTTTYNALYHRYARATVRGIVVQPKTFNVGDPQYALKAKALVLGLRAVFGRQDLPVCWMQMHSPGRYEVRDAQDPAQWVRMRSAQNALAGLPHVSVVATYDLKATNRNEPDVCHRAARWAAAPAGNGPVRSGPAYKSHRIEGSAVAVEFARAGQGLMVGTWRTGKGVLPATLMPMGFELAGVDGTWHAATGVVRGRTVVVTCDKVARPKAVRYAWAPQPAQANLYNRAGFPALPFSAP